MAEMRNNLFAAAFTDFLLDTLASGRNMIADVASELKPTNLMGRMTNAVKTFGNVVGVCDSDGINLSQTFRAAAVSAINCL